MDFPSISIVIPTLNAARTLKDCFLSINQQAYPNDLIEVIILDGGSIDNTKEIVKEFNFILVEDSSTRNNQEARKAIGLSKAKNDLVLFIDADNILTHDQWLKNMISPLVEDNEIIGVQPLRYHYDRKLSLMNRYFALFGVNDPVAYYFNKRDRLSWMEDAWNLMGQAEDKGSYFKVEFEKDKLPTLGANGFLVRREVINKAKVSPEQFFHIDVNYDLVDLGFNKYAIIKDDIIHLTGDSFSSFLRKRLYYMMKFHQQSSSLRRYKLIERKDFFMLVYFILISITLIKPLYDSFKGFKKIKDPAWFLHPVMCVSIIFIYVFGLIVSLKKENKHV